MSSAPPTRARTEAPPRNWRPKLPWQGATEDEGARTPSDALAWEARAGEGVQVQVGIANAHRNGHRHVYENSTSNAAATAGDDDDDEEGEEEEEDDDEDDAEGEGEEGSEITPPLSSSVTTDDEIAQFTSIAQRRRRNALSSHDHEHHDNELIAAAAAARTSHAAAKYRVPATGDRPERLPAGFVWVNPTDAAALSRRASPNARGVKPTAPAADVRANAGASEMRALNGIDNEHLNMSSVQIPGMVTPNSRKEVLAKWGTIRVPEDASYIVERAGVFHRLLQPGFRILWPGIDKIKYVFSRRMQKLVFASAHVPTADKVLVSVKATLFYIVEDPVTAAYAVDDVEDALVDLAAAAISHEFGRMRVDSLYSDLDYLWGHVAHKINKSSMQWGTRCMRFATPEIKLPPELTKRYQELVHARLRQRVSEARTRGDAIDREARAERLNRDIRLTAKSRTAVLRSQARADADAILLKGDANASALQSIAEALERPHGRDAARVWIATRYIEALSLSMSQNNATVNISAANPSKIVDEAMNIVDGKLRRSKSTSRVPSIADSSFSPMSPPPPPQPAFTSPRHSQGQAPERDRSRCDAQGRHRRDRAKSHRRHMPQEDDNAHLFSNAFFGTGVPAHPRRDRDRTHHRRRSASTRESHASQGSHDSRSSGSAAPAHEKSAADNNLLDWRESIRKWEIERGLEPSVFQDDDTSEKHAASAHAASPIRRKCVSPPTLPLAAAAAAAAAAVAATPTESSDANADEGWEEDVVDLDEAREHRRRTRRENRSSRAHAAAQRTQAKQPVAPAHASSASSAASKGKQEDWRDEVRVWEASLNLRDQGGKTTVSKQQRELPAGRMSHDLGAHARSRSRKSPVRDLPKSPKSPDPAWKRYLQELKGDDEKDKGEAVGVHDLRSSLNMSCSDVRAEEAASPVLTGWQGVTRRAAKAVAEKRAKKTERSTGNKLKKLIGVGSTATGTGSGITGGGGGAELTRQSSMYVHSSGAKHGVIKTGAQEKANGHAMEGFTEVT